jgi:hypothetical protein
MRDPVTGKAHTTIVFNSKESASNFKAFIPERPGKPRRQA